MPVADTIRTDILAKHIATKFHAGQTYGEKPYTFHLEQVYHSVERGYPGDERLLAVAWLHDVLEDSLCTEAVLRSLFDKDVVDAVVAMSYGGGGMAHNGESREEYLQRVRANPLAAKVKMHDAFCNLRESLMRGDMKRVKKYGETLRVLAA